MEGTKQGPSCPSVQYIDEHIGLRPLVFPSPTHILSLPVSRRPIAPARPSWEDSIPAPTLQRSTVRPLGSATPWDCISEQVIAQSEVLYCYRAVPVADWELGPGTAGAPSVGSKNERCGRCSRADLSLSLGPSLCFNSSVAMFHTEDSTSRGEGEQPGRCR